MRTNTMKFVVIPVDDQPYVTEIGPCEDGRFDTLDVLQELVGGWIECVCLIGDSDAALDMWVNEEGRVNGMEPNPQATRLVQVTNPEHAKWNAPYHGPAVVAMSFEGETVGLKHDLIDALEDEIGMSIRRGETV